MNHEEVLAAIPDGREETKSIEEIAQDVGLEISSYVAGEGRATVFQALGTLINGVGSPCGERQKEECHKLI